MGQSPDERPTLKGVLHLSCYTSFRASFPNMFNDVLRQLFHFKCIHFPALKETAKRFKDLSKTRYDDVSGVLQSIRFVFLATWKFQSLFNGVYFFIIFRFGFCLVLALLVFVIACFLFFCLEFQIIRFMGSWFVPLRQYSSSKFPSFYPPPQKTVNEMIEVKKKLNRLPTNYARTTATLAEWLGSLGIIFRIVGEQNEMV